MIIADTCALNTPSQNALPCTQKTAPFSLFN